jgi:hypothetical protein
VVAEDDLDFTAKEKATAQLSPLEYRESLGMAA